MIWKLVLITIIQVTRKKHERVRIHRRLSDLNRQIGEQLTSLVRTLTERIVSKTRGGIEVNTLATASFSRSDS